MNLICGGFFFSWGWVDEGVVDNLKWSNLGSSCRDRRGTSISVLCLYLINYSQSKLCFTVKESEDYRKKLMIWTEK